MIIQFLFLLCPKMSSVCQDCGKTFPNLRKLNIHKIVHNNTEVNCNICNVICVGKKKFLDHIKIHQTFECEVCGQTVKTNSKTHHMKKCQGNGIKLKCDQCPYEIDKLSRLEHHVSKKHGSQPTEQFFCVHCKKEFDRNDNLERHIKTHTKNPH